MTVLTPNGRRQNVKITPNTTILQILEETCLKHGFSSDEYCLKHYNKVISLSQTFRFSGLPKNCQLEMHPTDKKRVAQPVDICVQTEDGARKQAKFIPEDNLLHVLHQLQGEVELQKYKNPVVLYMRQEIIGLEQLSKTNLKSLGILEGGALLRLLDKQLEQLKTLVKYLLLSQNIAKQLNLFSISRQAAVYKPTEPTKSQKVTDVESDKAKNVKCATGTGFSITKELVQSLKQSSSNANTDYKDNSNDTNNEPSCSAKSDEPLEPAKPKYDWGLGPGRSMRSSEVNMELDENETLKPIIEPEYHIVCIIEIHIFLLKNTLLFSLLQLGDRSAVIYSLDNTQSETEDLPDSFYDLTVNDLKLVLRDLKNIVIGNEDSPLLTEKLREIEHNNTMLRKIAQYKNCVIRIQFPDRHVLQGMFKPIDRISDVKAFISNYLETPEKPFYLCK